MIKVLTVFAMVAVLLPMVFAPSLARAQTPTPTPNKARESVPAGLVQVASDSAKRSLQAKRIVGGKPQMIRLSTASRICIGDVVFVPPGSRPILAFYNRGTRFRLAPGSVVRVGQDAPRRVRGAAFQILASYNPQLLGAFSFDTPSARFGVVKGGDLQRSVFRLLPVGAILTPNKPIAVAWAGTRTVPASPLQVSLLRRGETGVLWSGAVPAGQSPPFFFAAPGLDVGGVYDCVCESDAGIRATGTVRVLSERDAKAVGANAAFLQKYIGGAKDADERGGTYCLLALLYEKHELFADADAAYEKARTLLPDDRLLKMAPRKNAPTP
ncbi:MAG: hypothetical protein H7Y38_12445 [Armatimonadetes bacterium]|nr:hypothetical protein [Armatimonadota bacterium]